MDYGKVGRDKRRSEAHRAAADGSAARRSQDEHVRRRAADAYAAEHGLACFRCRKTTGPFARARREPDGRRWALCLACFKPTSRSG